MCLITYSRTGELLDRDRFRASHSHNNDGMGFMWHQDGRVEARRYVGTEDELWKQYQQVEGKPHALHQRFATSGGRKTAMAHPFRILSKDRDGVDIYMMHNGVISSMPTTQNHSDTFVFVRDYLRPLLAKDPELFKQKHFSWLLASAIGSGNKLLFMTSFDNNAYIINKSAGKDEDKFWFSNSYSLTGFHRSTYKYPHSGQAGYQQHQQPSLPIVPQGSSCPVTQKANVTTTVEDLSGEKKRRPQTTHTVDSLAGLSSEDLAEPTILSMAIRMLDNLTADEFTALQIINEDIISEIWDRAYPNKGFEGTPN